eukprot:Nk52_evm20s2355 gene=Nk52_evmTU20s2355
MSLTEQEEQSPSWNNHHVDSSSSSGSFVSRSRGFTQSIVDKSPFREADAQKDAIRALPAMDFTLPFRMASGYLNVHRRNDRNLFYWFVEAEEDPLNKPIMVWENGGPGSSSIGNGFFMSHGPVKLFKDNQTLYRNPQSWNKIANVLFLDNPVGVGFSYSGVETDYMNITDNFQKTDAARAVQMFLKKFPEFAHLPLFCGGESYGGHYVPNLVSEILRINEVNRQFVQTGVYPAEEEDQSFYRDYKEINIKGLMVGNGLTNPGHDFRGTVKNLYDQHYMSDEKFNTLMEKCNFDDFNMVMDADFQPLNENEKMCHATWMAIEGTFKDTFNIYNIHKPNVCAFADVSKRMGEKCKVNADPSDYLNRKDVQEAIHADPSKMLPASKGQWMIATPQSKTGWNYDQNSIRADMMPVYEHFLDNHPELRILIYSGTFDVILPTTGTLNWMRHLQEKRSMEITSRWSSWSIDNSTVSGFTFAMDRRIRFVSVLEAGHVVPMDQPEKALTLLSSFLDDTALPYLEQVSLAL